MVSGCIHGGRSLWHRLEYVMCRKQRSLDQNPGRTKTFGCLVSSYFLSLSELDLLKAPVPQVRDLEFRLWAHEETYTFQILTAEKGKVSFHNGSYKSFGTYSYWTLLDDVPVSEPSMAAGEWSVQVGQVCVMWCLWSLAWPGPASPAHSSQMIPGSMVWRAG